MLRYYKLGVSFGIANITINLVREFEFWKDCP